MGENSGRTTAQQTVLGQVELAAAAAVLATCHMRMQLPAKWP